MFVLTQTNSVANHFLSELRDVTIQKDRLRFRRNMERLGEILAYEISKTFQYSNASIQTPLGNSETNLFKNQPVIATVLRAGIPFYQGFLNFFDHSDSAFVAAYRDPQTEGADLKIKLEYVASPDISNRPLVLIDPMLATGKSLITTYNTLLKFGTPSSVHVASVIASQAAIEFLQKTNPEFTIWLAGIDPELNEKAYIVPGLGDAGDLSFGDKK